MEYLWILSADLLMAIDFSLNKMYQKKCGASIAAGYRFNLYTGLFKALIFWAINGFTFEFTGFSAIMAMLMAAVCFGYILLGQQILKVSQVAVYTLFLMLGGMCVPYIWGAAVLHEQLNLFRILGLITIAAALIVMNLSERPKKKQLLMCIGVFVLNGFCSVISKEHQIAEINAVSSAGFVALSGLASALFSIIGLMTVRIKRQQKPNIPKGRGMEILAFSALIGGVSYMMQLNAAKSIPATALYPMLSGGSIALSVITGYIFFKEKPSKKHMIGTVFCLLGTAMFML